MGDLLSGSGLTVNPSDLSGPVTVVSGSELAGVIKRKMEETRAEVIKEAIGPGDVPRMLDNYLDENIDLKARLEETQQQIAGYEKKIGELEASGGGGGGLDLTAFTSFDVEAVRTEVTAFSDTLSAIETALNEVENMEESWVFIEKIAQIRNDVNHLLENMETAAGEFITLTGSSDPDPVGLISSVKDLECVAREGRALEKVLSFLQSLLGLDE